MMANEEIFKRILIMFNVENSKIVTPKSELALLEDIYSLSILSGYPHDFCDQVRISTTILAIVLNTKNTTRQIPYVRVMCHLFNGTTINILVRLRNSETVETRSVLEIVT